MKDSIIRLIQREIDLNCRYFLCDALYSIMKKESKLISSTSEDDIILSIHFSQIFGFGHEIVKSPIFLSTGLYLWRNIFVFFHEYDFSVSDENENSELITNFLFDLLNISSISLSSENNEDRLQSLRLLDILYSFLVEIENLNDIQFSIVNNAFQHLHQEYNRALNSSSLELSQFCSVICSFIEDPPFFVNEEILLSFLELTLNVLSNSKIPIEKRVIVHTILESSVDLIVNNDGYRSKIGDILNISISLSVDVCRLDRNDNNYEFPFRFLYLLSDALNVTTSDGGSGGESIFNLFMSISVGLVGNESINESFEGRQVSLFVIKSIIESLQEIVSIKIHDVVHFILQCGDCGDENVFNSSCQTLDELFGYVSSSASKYIDEITSFLIKYIVFPISIQTLDSILYRSDKPPTNAESIFKGLAGMISVDSSNEQIEILLSCITSLLSRFPGTDESILSTFLPFINEIISMPSHSDLYSAILEFFGRIVSVAPITVKNELPNLLPFIIDSISMSNFQLDTAAAFCLRSFAKVLPISFAQFLPQVLPPLIAILQSHGDDDSEDEDVNLGENSNLNETESANLSGNESRNPNEIQEPESCDENLLLNDFAKAQRESMLTLATFVGYMPHEMAEYAQTPILDFIVSEKGGLHNFLVRACESVAYSAEGYKILGIPVFNVINQIFPLMFDQTAKKDDVFSILMVASEIVAVFGNQMSDEVINLIITSLINILSSPPPAFLLSDASYSTLDPQIQAPLFFLFSQAIDMFSENRFESYFEEICQILMKYFNNDSNKSFILKCNTILIAAHLCSSYPSSASKLGTFCQIVQNISIQALMSSQSNEANLLIAKAIKYLIFADKNQMLPRLNILIEFSNSVIENVGYFGLFCALLMTYFDSFDVSKCVGRINEFIYNLPPLPDSENVVLYSEFSVFLLKNGIELNNLNLKLPFVASALFASSDKHFNAANPEIKAIFASILSRTPEEILVSINKADEFKISRIQNHIRMMNPS